MTRTYRRTLTIAGSDSGGGAGIQADLKTFAALGCYGTSAITALTAQNTVGVQGIHAVPPDMIAAQITSVCTDIGTDAVKVGMVHSADAIAAVADGLAEHGPPNVVVDPVMVAASGDPLFEQSAMDALRERLVAVADLVTPNLAEAALLVDGTVESNAEIREACHAITRLGAGAVLIKGGHGGGERSVDTLYLADFEEFVSFDAARVETANTHGTGCTLSSAIAARLAHGATLVDAVRDAKDYLTAALQAGAARTLGTGHGPVHHFHALWPEDV